MTNWPLSCDVFTVTNSPRMRAVVSPSASLVGMPSTPDTGLLGSVVVVVVDVVLVVLVVVVVVVVGELGAAATARCDIVVVGLGAAASARCDIVVVGLGASASALFGNVVVTAGNGVVAPSLPDDARVVVVASAAITVTDCDAVAAEFVLLPD